MKLIARDLIAIIALVFCFFLIYRGVDTYITALTSLIIGYYFSKRVFEEKTIKQKEVEIKVS